MSVEPGEDQSDMPRRYGRMIAETEKPARRWAGWADVISGVRRRSLDGEHSAFRRTLAFPPNR